ncbi:MAG: NUDIX hydrolase [Nitrososphaerota archaeon]|nr:NUDIX hydrolase [Nitrososphaerota archaeon]
MRRESFDAGIRVLASVAILRGKKILLIKEQEEPYNGLWVLPQGYVKQGETVSDAANREVHEELGVEVELDGLVGIYDDFHDGSNPVHYVIATYFGTINGSAEPRPTTEAIDSAWVDVSKGLPAVPPVMRRMLHDVARGTGRKGRAVW